MIVAARSGVHPTLNVFTCANRPYEDFVPLFVSSVLWSNPGSHVEVGLEDVSEIAKTPLLDAMSEAFGDAYTVRDVAWHTSAGRKILPNSVRFVTEPAVKADYIYISDIDIVTLNPNIVAQHVQHMAATSLPYSNWVRTDTTRLTGLHFAAFDFQYPLPDLSDLLAERMNDEMLLFKIVKRKLGHDPVSQDRFRPVHGIHISPNRAPRGDIRDGVQRPGWGIKLYWKNWEQYRRSDAFLAVQPHLSDRMARCVDQIDQIAITREEIVEIK